MSDWYYTIGGERRGPVSEDALRTEIASGALQPRDLVWRTGMPQWVTADTLPELGFTHQPAANLGTVAYAQPHSDSVTFTPRALDLLRATRPWVRFISILTFIVAGLMTIGGVIAIIAIASSRHPEEAVFGLIYIVLGLLYLAPGVYLGRYAARISDTINMRREDSLEKAIEAQKSFWKFVGILFLLMIGLWVLGIVIAIIVAILN